MGIYQKILSELLLESKLIFLDDLYCNIVIIV